MRHSLAAAVTFAWALWFGGLMTLFLLITGLLHAFSTRREIFDEIGGVVFQQFEHYQLILAAAALLLSAFSAAVGGTTRLKLVVLVLFILATAGAIVETSVLRPQLERLLAANPHHDPDPAFRRAHGLSMLTYGVEAVLLFVAGLLLMRQLRDVRAE